MRIAVLSLLVFSFGCARGPESPLGLAAAAGDLAGVQRLLAEGARPDGLEGERWTPLGRAARHGHLDVLRALVAAGARVDRPDRANRWTPLMHAIHKGQTGAVAALLEAGADPNARGGGGVTPLMMAAGYGQTGIVRRLLARGADPRALSDAGLNALWSAAGGGAIADITDGPAFGSCFPETARVLREAAPDLKLPAGDATRLLAWLARGECKPLLRE